MSKVTEKMRKIFCKKNTIVAACAVAVIAVSGSIAYAATANGYDPVTAKQNGGWTSTVTGTQYNSYGKINYTNGSNSVVVDAADIAAIDNMVGEGKTQIKNAIHAVDTDDRLGTSAWTETTFPDFGNLASLISGSQTLTEAQAGTQALNNNGEALYYKDQAASEARDLTQTCTDDTGYPVYYQSATAANLTAGSAAFVDGKLILGTGADNDAYVEFGNANTEVISSIFDNPLSDKYKYIVCFNATKSQHQNNIATYSNITCTNGEIINRTCFYGTGGTYDWNTVVYLIKCNGAVTIHASHTNKSVAYGIW